jgi:hypothetical protein
MALINFISIVVNEYRTRYVKVFGVGGKTLRTSHPSGLR